MIKIIWFKNSHEQSLNWLKFGLMQLHKKKEITFIEKDNDQLKSENVSDVIKNHKHRRTVILKVIKNEVTKFVFVDAEDSFFHLRSIIADVDFYFISSYNSDFFIHKKTDYLLSWHKIEDVKEYKEIATDLIGKYGNEFYKVKKLFPIGPGLDLQLPKSGWLQSKLKNLQFKFYKNFFGSNNWEEAYKLFQKRYAILLSYRNEPLVYDVVALDTLWGWPEHRMELHNQLKQHSTQFNILSELRFNDNKHTTHIDSKDFPIVSHPISGNYEQKLASSRLGVFATGYHFGWRNIVMVALMVGIPIYSDEIILEPYFDWNLFKIFYNKGNFEDLPNLLHSISETEWQKIKQYNQGVFDRYMHPIKVAEYFIKTISESV